MKTKGLLLLLLLHFSCVIIAKNPEEAHLIVHYWPNKGSAFGHVAIEVTSADAESIYLSYRMRNNLKRDLAKLGASQTVRLPLLSDDAFSNYQEWLQNGPYWQRKRRYGREYNFFTFNCAHAVSNALKFLGYNTGWSDYQFALSPRQVWRRAKTFQKT